MDGLAIVLDTLAEETRGEAERREAAGVVAQLTSPWVGEELACLEALKASLPRLLASTSCLLSQWQKILTTEYSLIKQHREGFRNERDLSILQ